MPGLLAILVSLALAKAPSVPEGAFEVHTRTAAVDHEGNKLPVRASWPVGEGPFPVILMAHGIHGDRDRYRPLTHYWASHGYVVLQATHDDRSLDPDQRPSEVRAMLARLDALTAHEPELRGKVDVERVGVAGHSLGALTALILGGMTVTDPRTGRTHQGREPRTDALLILSPPGLSEWLDGSEVTGPALLVTGSRDEVAPTRTGPDDRLRTWEALRSDSRWLVWIDDAKHTFGGIGEPKWTAGRRVHSHVAIVQKATLAFWDATLKDDPTDLEWLQTDALRTETRGAAHIRPGDRPASAEQR